MPVIKTAGIGETIRQTDEWNRIEGLEIDPHKYSQLIFDKGTKEIQCSKDSLFPQMVLEQLDIHMQKQSIQTQTLIPQQTLTQNRTDVNVKCKL